MGILQDRVPAVSWLKVWLCRKNILTSVRTSLSNGLPLYHLPDALDLSQLHSHHENIIARLSPKLYWTQRLQKTFAHGVTQLLNFSASMATPSEGSSLRSLIDVIDTQILDTSKDAGPNIGTCCRNHSAAASLIQNQIPETWLLRA